MEIQESARILPKSKLDDLIGLLQSEGFEVVGPCIEQGAIVYGPLRCAEELPIGWTDQQAPGSYRLQRRSDNMYFGFAVGPHSWKKYLFPPSLVLWNAERTADGFTVTNRPVDPPRRALLGVRSCELHAIAIQDRVFLKRDGSYTDPYYARARENLLLIAVECEIPGATCFCTSMGTGPAIEAERIPLPQVNDNNAPPPTAFDLALTELDEEFVVQIGSAAGAELVNRLQLNEASEKHVEAARQRVAMAAAAMNKSVDVSDIRNVLHDNQEHPRWDDVAERCLACTNCTMVCPTCFCSSVQDVNDLTLENAQRVRQWDSCFSPDFAYVHGGNYRPSIRGRYRQWLTHKFASWHDQFDVSGCVGCGRCITWCPVGIDVTEEITAIRESSGRNKEDDS